MTLVDSRGRVFGLVNLIDLACVLAAIFAAVLGAAAYRVFVIPEPVLERVQPVEVTMAAKPRVTLLGRHLRHYLHVYVPRTGEPFSVTPLVPRPEVRLGAVTDNRIDLDLPALLPGAYDVYLFDETKQLAHWPAAFNVILPRYPRGFVDVVMLTYMSDGWPTIVKPGDRDVATISDPALPNIGAAQVTSIRTRSDRTQDREMTFGEYNKNDQYLWFSQLVQRVIVEVRLRVPVSEVKPGRWQYKQMPVRVGESFQFETDKYRQTGLIVSIGNVQPWR